MYINDIKINYLSLDGFDDSAREKLLNSNDYFKDKGGVETPLLLVVKNSTIVDYLEGVSSRKEYNSFLKDNSIISE
jgi:hypothetical protein